MARWNIRIVIDMFPFIMEEGAQRWDAQPLEVRPYNMLPVISKIGGVPGVYDIAIRGELL